MEIKLTGKRGGHAIISKIDYALLSKYKWCQDNDGYVKGNVDGILIKMHKYIVRQYITNIPKNKIVDHINSNRLDNRRKNLRLASIQINNQNKSISKSKKSSVYKCVYYDNRIKKYNVKTDIGANGKTINLGYYKSEIGAAEIYDMYLVHNGFSNAKLNFPEKRNKYLKRKYIPYQKDKKSKYVGVTKRSKNSFRAQIRINGKLIIIKNSSSEKFCAKAYDKYIVDNNIPGKKLNFPKEHLSYNPNSIVKTECKKTDDKNILYLLIKTHPNLKVMIDKDEYVNVKYYSWHLSNDGYVRAKVNGKNIRLHRFITKINGPDIFVDHIDSNIYNNCKNNLRLSNSQKNSQNKSKSKNTSSKYLGVSLNKQRSKWEVKFKKYYKNMVIGSYANEIYAGRARDLYILIHHKDDHYKLNFEWTDQDIAYWKKKIIPISKKSDKWIAKTYTQEIKSEMSRIIKALNNDKLLMVENLNNNLNKKMNNRNRERLKVLETVME